MKVRRPTVVARAALAGWALAAFACGQNPETTERARGVLTGANIVLALTIGFIVIAGGLLVGVIALDRFVRTRQALEAAPPEEPEKEPEEEVVAGIGVGRAGVPRWLYGFYFLIPVFALLYVFNNVALQGPEAAEKPKATKAPRGPVTETTIVASGIKFNLSKLTFPAGKEITVIFDNADTGVPHNFTVWPDEASAQAGDTAKALHAGNTFSGAASSTEKFTIPAAGSDYFNCTIHPTSMFGTIEVVGG
jgi:plastocyanin